MAYTNNKIDHTPFKYFILKRTFQNLRLLHYTQFKYTWSSGASLYKIGGNKI